MALFFTFLKVSQVIFLVLLIAYASFLVISLVIGGVHLYEKNERKKSLTRNKEKIPISIIVPAYNESTTIVSSIDSIIATQTCKDVFQRQVGKVKLTLIVKENGGKGDALNMGINAANYDYFLCLDADSMLQVDSLSQISKSIQVDPTVIAVGGLVQVAQGVKIEQGKVASYRLPWRIIPCAQALEYDSSFLGARIFLDYLRANLIISGAFGLFKKDLVKAVGGYDTQTLGEDMELVMKLHFFCRNNNIPYRICYETDAVCWSQAPTNLGDLRKQRRRWYLGLY